MNGRLLAWACCLAWLAQPAAQAAGVRVYPRVESGAHEAEVNAVAALPGEDGIVTVSDDKTARLWSDQLAPLGVMRPPLGASDIGALYAVAASEKAIAVAGRLQDDKGHFGVAVYARADLTGAALVMWNFSAPVMALRFSRSGRLLAVGMQGGALRVIDLVARTLAFRDDSFAGSVIGLDFDANDRLAVASDGGGLKLFEPDWQAARLPTPPKSAAPWHVAFSPDGGQLAIGDSRQPVVRLLDTRKLRFEPELRGAGLTAGSLAAVAYAADGKTLYAAGSYTDRTGDMHIRRFTLGPRPTATDMKVSRQTVTDLLPVAHGVIATTADPAIYRVEDGGGVAASVTTQHADFRADPGHALLISADGSVVDFPGLGAGRVRFDAVAHAIVEPDARPMLRPFAAVRGFAVTEWINSHTPRLNGQLLALDPGETVRAAAVLPDGASAAIGTDFYLRLAGRVGQIWQIPTEAPVWAVNVSGDGRLVVAALGDGTVHWVDAASGRELLALLLEPATGRFVLWTQAGFFDHDHRDDGKPDGRSMIGYRFNRASGRDSLFVEIGQLYPLFFRPDLVGLAFRDDAAAHRVLDEQMAQLGDVGAALGGGLPAHATVLEVCAMTGDSCGPPLDREHRAARTESETVRVRYRLEDATGRPGKATITRNDAVVGGDVTIAATEAHARVEQATIGLVTGMNHIRLSPLSPNGAIEATEAAAVTLDVERMAPPPPPPVASDSAQGPARPAPGRTPPARTLYVLSVGVGEFEAENLDMLELPNASRDASAVARMFETPSPPVYDRPIVTSLAGRDASREKIIAALRHITAQSRPDDMVVIFFAGHGLSVGGRYYFAADDLGAGEAESISHIIHPETEAARDEALAAMYQRHGLSQDELLPLLQAIPASRVAVFLDTCYSATAATADAVLRRDLNATVTNRLGHATGRFVLSSAFREAADSGGEGMADHGLFTAYLLRAFEGEADIGRSGMIDIYKLATYVRRSVLEDSTRLAAAKGDDGRLQEPSFYFAGNDFFELRAVRAPPTAAVSH